ncbi:MAG: hypothetical protein HOP16_18055 [Acidobacteria bacterium]|nr:hypothetical protein [Acidobacteriota bacterium]
MKLRLVRLIVLCLAVPAVARAAAADPMLFTLFLTDGTSLVSFGEFARVDDRVVFSLAGGSSAEPRLQVATLPASKIDWPRTNRHAASTRYQWYASTRGEEDFLRLSDNVADVLNQVVQNTDRTKALGVAQEARATLAEWPREHFGYRQEDVREILSFLDGIIADLRAATGVSSFDLALVASPPPIEIQPLAVMPSPRDQVDQVLRLASLTERASERVVLLRSALDLLDSAATIIPRRDALPLRKAAERQLEVERDTDVKYADLSHRLVDEATKGASRARVDDVQRVLNKVPREDAKLGGRRPETVQALRASIEAQLDAARRFRLLQDRWTIRRSLYRDYQRSVSTHLTQLVKSQPDLEAIRGLDGPTPETLVKLRARLRGGAAYLERMRPPEDLKTTHDLLVGAWRFAENAVNERYAAARAGDVRSAWQASSAAGGALLLLSRVQQEIRESLEPPKLQ